MGAERGSGEVDLMGGGEGGEEGKPLRPGQQEQKELIVFIVRRSTTPVA